MSYYFESIVVQTHQASLIRVLEQLDDSDDLDHVFLPITMNAYSVTEEGFVIFGWRIGSKRPNASQEIESLCHELSQKFGIAVAVHYDDQTGMKEAMLSREGKPVRYFDERDEIWVPYSKDGDLVADGCQYSGNALPEDVECDCICNGIDAALKVAGWQEWLTSKKLVQLAYRNDPLWHRPGLIGC